MASYTLTLSCGCTVYVACRPTTGLAHTRILETRGSQCFNRRHERGTRLWLWELLPGGDQTASVRFNGPDSVSAEGVSSTEGSVTSLW